MVPMLVVNMNDIVNYAFRSLVLELIFHIIYRYLPLCTFSRIGLILKYVRKNICNIYIMSNPGMQVSYNLTILVAQRFAL